MIIDILGETDLQVSIFPIKPNDECDRGSDRFVHQESEDVPAPKLNNISATMTHPEPL